MIEEINALISIRFCNYHFNNFNHNNILFMWNCNPHDSNNIQCCLSAWSQFKHHQIQKIALQASSEQSKIFWSIYRMNSTQTRDSVTFYFFKPYGIINLHGIHDRMNNSPITQYSLHIYDFSYQAHWADCLPYCRKFWSRRGMFKEVTCWEGRILLMDIRHRCCRESTCIGERKKVTLPSRVLKKTRTADQWKGVSNNEICR